jgi:hypothetical protein
MVQIKQLIQDKPDAFLVISDDSTAFKTTAIAERFGGNFGFGTGFAQRIFTQMIKCFKGRYKNRSRILKAAWRRG